MKITEVRSIVVYGGLQNWVLVEVETDDGIVGVGEASISWLDRSADEAVDWVSRYVIGQDPFEIERLWQTMYRETYYRGGPIPQVAISGIDMALWDIVGKALGVPCYQLLGGICHDRLRLYANAWYADANTPDEFARAAAEVVARGYTALKFDPFGAADMTIDPDSLRLAVARVAAVREAIGPDVELLLEAHGRFNIYTAVEVARELARFKPRFYEEPIPPENLDALADVRRQVPIPIATGERLYSRWGYRELLAKQAADIVQPDLAWVGGITEAKKVAALAAASYVPVAPHNCQGPIAMAATVQFAVSTPNVLFLEYFVRQVPWRDQLVTTPLAIEGGYLRPPSTPGLGVGQLDPAVARAHPRQPTRLSLWRSDWQAELQDAKGRIGKDQTS